MTSPLAEHGDASAMASPTAHEKLPTESITGMDISPPSTQSPAPTLEIEEEQPINKMATPAPPAPQAPTLPSRNTDQVIAELKRPAPSAHVASPFSPKRRLTSYASMKSGSSLSDLPEAPTYTGANGHDNPSGDIEEDEPVESSDEEDVLPTAKPRKITERKRRLNAIADSYMQKRTQKQLKEGNKVRPEDEAQQSARWLVNQSENREIISSPREYQVELFEKAKEKNIIAVLDTGARLLYLLNYFC
jgi:endoribonuclease Dicer